MTQKYALLIGNNNYTDPYLAQLAGPVADVSALEEVLKNRRIGNFGSVVTLIDEQRPVITREIDFLFSNKAVADLVLLYFSGHGIVDSSGQLYLAIHETEYDLPRGTAISAGFVKEVMDNSRSRRQVLILDCCHSGAFRRGTKGHSAVGKKDFNRENVRSRGVRS